MCKDPNTVGMKINITTQIRPEELFFLLPKHLGRISRINRGFSKKEKPESLFKAGIIGYGRNPSSPIAEYSLLLKSRSCGTITDIIIWFKVNDDHGQSLKDSISILLNCIGECGAKKVFQSQDVILKKKRETQVFHN